MGMVTWNESSWFSNFATSVASASPERLSNWIVFLPRGSRSWFFLLQIIQLAPPGGGPLATRKSCLTTRRAGHLVFGAFRRKVSETSMIPHRHRLARRRLLRGVGGVLLGLPALDVFEGCAL